MRASAVVNCQCTGVPNALRSRTQAAISARSKASLAMRRSRHWAARAANSISALYPLVLALRQLAGEEVRAPAEVMEVAADIRGFVKRLEAVVNGVAK